MQEGDQAGQQGQAASGGAGEGGSLNLDALLASEEVLEAGVCSSTVESCCEMLAGCAEVKKLAGDAEQAKKLALCVRSWLEVPYNRRCRHPKETPICAIIVLLAGHQSVTEVKDLFAEIENIAEPSMSWVCMTVKHIKSR